MFLNQVLDDGKIGSGVLPDHFVVVDLETTGFSPLHDDIIEIGALRIDRDRETPTVFQTLVRPAHPIPPRVAQVTGLSQAVLENRGLALDDAMRKFVAFVGDLRLVLFNAPFDMGFLERAAEACGVEINNRITSVVRMAREAWPGLPSYKLNQLAKTGGLPVEGSHRALKDCQMVLDVYTAAAFELHRAYE